MQGYQEILFVTALAGGGETWVTDQTLYNSDYCWNTESLNTYLNKNVSLTAALSLFVFFFLFFFL